MNKEKEINNKIIKETKSEKDKNIPNINQTNEKQPIKSKNYSKSSDLQNSAFKAIKSETESTFM